MKEIDIGKQGALWKINELSNEAFKGLVYLQHIVDLHV